LFYTDQILKKRILYRPDTKFNQKKLILYVINIKFLLSFIHQIIYYYLSIIGGQKNRMELLNWTKPNQKNWTISNDSWTELKPFGLIRSSLVRFGIVQIGFKKLSNSISFVFFLFFFNGTNNNSSVRNNSIQFEIVRFGSKYKRFNLIQLF